MNKKYKKLLFVIPIILICVISVAAGYVFNIQSGISQKVVRLHIIAATDSVGDQLVKLSVRDKILEEFSNIFDRCETAEEAEKQIKIHLAEIENCANRELLRQGSADKAAARIEKCRFPTKRYGAVSLPAGEYTALNIKIGAAGGRNWWCVMYPPLCINDSVVSLSDRSMEYLKENLTDEEYSLITDDNIEIKIKFRLAEILFGK